MFCCFEAPIRKNAWNGKEHEISQNRWILTIKEIETHEHL